MEISIHTIMSAIVNNAPNTTKRELLDIAMELDPLTPDENRMSDDELVAALQDSNRK